MKEIEIRALVEHSDRAKHQLIASGFKQHGPIAQIDMIFDRPDASLFRSGQKLRIRIEGGEATLTYKGVFEGADGVSRRQELDIPVDKAQIGNYMKLFEWVGLPLCFQIPKTREIFVRNDISVCFDEWPIIGCLVEIEGPEASIVQFASDVFPGIQFRNYRLRELFRMIEVRHGKSTAELQQRYEAETGQRLGRLDLILA